MKLFFRTFAIVAIAGVMMACNDDDYPSVNVLDTPQLSVGTPTDKTVNISWKSVGNATNYLYSLNGGAEQSTTATSLDLAALSPSTKYTFKVKAIKSESLYFVDSEYAETSFTTAAKPTTETRYRVATFADDWDKWYYEYNTDNTVKRIYRLNGDGSLDREWVFAYNGTTVTTTGKNAYTMTLNSDGLVKTFLKEAGSEYTYTYDANGYMTQVKLNGTIVSNCVVENGNIVKWSKWTKQGDDTEAREHFKVQSYSTSDKNVAGTHCIYSESAGPSHWLVETGLFGKGSAYCHLTSGWDYSAVSASFTFEKDSNGCISKEIKLYGGDTENFFYSYDSYQAPIN